MYEKMSQYHLVYEVIQSRRLNWHIWNDSLIKNKEIDFSILLFFKKKRVEYMRTCNCFFSSKTNIQASHSFESPAQNLEHTFAALTKSPESQTVISMRKGSVRGKTTFSNKVMNKFPPDLLGNYLVLLFRISATFRFDSFHVLQCLFIPSPLHQPHNMIPPIPGFHKHQVLRTHNYIASLLIRIQRLLIIRRDLH